MNVTLSLDDALVEQLNKIATERDTTLDAVVSACLRPLAEAEAELRKQRNIEALKQTFQKYQFEVGPRTWTRDDLYERD